MSVRAMLRRDLRQAMRDRDRASASTLRAVLAAIDNAEAVPADDHGPAQPATGLARDVPRRELSEADITLIVRAESDELRGALEGYEAAGRTARAAELRTALELLDRYAPRQA